MRLTNQPTLLDGLAARGKGRRRIEGGDAPGWQGVTTENIGQYLREEQRSQAGCSAGRMQPAFCHGLLVVGPVPAGYVLLPGVLHAYRASAQDLAEYAEPRPGQSHDEDDDDQGPGH